MDLIAPLQGQDHPTVLLLGNYRPALTLARVLRRQGYKVICSVEGCDGGAEHCRYVDELWGHRPVGSDPNGFLADLKGFLRERPEIEVVYPVAEEFVRMFAEHEDRLPFGPVYAMTPPDLVKACLDKLGLMTLAVLNKVPTAPFEMVHSLSGFLQAVERVGLPLVIRPEKSTERIGGKKAVVCETMSDVQAVVHELANGMRNLLLQRKVEGRRHNLYFAAQNGEIVRYLHAVILRTDMPDGTGLAVEGETVEPDPELKDYATRLIKALGYTGVGCAQFLVNEHDGSVSFLEINPRIAGNHAVPEAAGLMLSTVAIALAQFPEKPVRSLEGKSGLRYVWTAGDLMGAKLAYLRGDVSAKESYRWLCHAISAAWRADVHMKWCWHDPLPGFFSLNEVLPSFRGLLRRARRWQSAKVEAWHGS
ncbi:MAG: ATP-grasp domain-containing protein [Rhizobiales bacterium]|nr:ATP-grasp domain-containing protein [Hyphomicrobiales bacterium]